MPGQDLVEEIKKLAKQHNIEAGIILSGVGSLTKARIRLPIIDADIKYLSVENLEIISLDGTISKSGIHLHISVSDINGKVLGGHLKEAWVRTTCELVIGVLKDIKFTRRKDSNTGYEELEVKNL